jgi:steroid delta-isomerase-like uncharacterized protein
MQATSSSNSTSTSTLSFALLIALTTFFCSCKEMHQKMQASHESNMDSAAGNLKMYSHVWDEIINHGKLDYFNDSNFTKDVVMHASPHDIIGIDSARAYYSNYLTGFSDITFSIVDTLASGNKLVKQWNFKGTHTGMFFGIPATGKKVSVDGMTMVRMQGGKIAEERDFFDNLEFMQQLGLIPR